MIERWAPRVSTGSKLKRTLWALPKSDETTELVKRKKLSHALVSTKDVRIPGGIDPTSLVLLDQMVERKHLGMGVMEVEVFMGDVSEEPPKSTGHEIVPVQPANPPQPEPPQGTAPLPICDVANPEPCPATTALIRRDGGANLSVPNRAIEVAIAIVIAKTLIAQSAAMFKSNVLPWVIG